MWTSGKAVARRADFCSILNTALRTDRPCPARDGAIFIAQST